MSIPQHIHDLLQAYFEGDTSPETTQAIEAWLKEDPANLQLFAEYGVIEDMLFSEQQSIDSEAVHTVITEFGPSAATSFDDFLQQPAFSSEPQVDTKKRLTSRELYSVGSYVLRHSLPRKKIAVLASAAVLLLGVVLSIVLLIGREENPETAMLPDFTPVNPSQNPNRVVATVTDQVNAQWVNANGEGALPDRMLLAVNQRLTLTKGFAEITTIRGAKVLLQAPATIETTDSDNAIRLHRGKLAGICETPSSKGFVVHAPGVDVVDLGTRFGIQADATKGTSILVMEGSVRAEPAKTSPFAFEPVVLLQNDARRIELETGSLVELAFEAIPVFYDAVPHPYVQAVLDANPAVYWRFENDTGHIIKSEVQPDRDHLNVIGTARLTEDGVVGKAALLANLAEPYAYFETRESIATMDTLEEYTIELWYLTNEQYEVAKDNSVGTLLTLYDPEQGNQFNDTTDARLLSLELGNDFWVGKPAKWWGVHRPPNWREHAVRCFPMRDLKSAEKQEIYSAKHYPVGRWQHLVFVKTADGVTLYLDGQPVDQAGYTPPMIGPAAVRLGRSVLDVVQEIDPDVKKPLGHGHQRALRGRLDEVALYPRALAPDQIKKHYELATGKALTDLID